MPTTEPTDAAEDAALGALVEALTMDTPTPALTADIETALAEIEADIAEPMPASQAPDFGYDENRWRDAIAHSHVPRLIATVRALLAERDALSAQLAAALFLFCPPKGQTS